VDNRGRRLTSEKSGRNDNLQMEIKHQSSGFLLGDVRGKFPSAECHSTARAPLLEKGEGGGPLDPQELSTMEAAIKNAITAGS